MFEVEVEVIKKEKATTTLQAGQYTLRRAEGFGVVEMEDAENPGVFIQEASTQLDPEDVELLFTLLEKATIKALSKSNEMFKTAKKVVSPGRIKKEEVTE